MTDKMEQHPIVLTTRDIQVIFSHLRKGPWEIVDPTLRSITTQWDSQVDAEDAAAKAAKKREAKAKRAERAKAKEDAERRAEAQRQLDAAHARNEARKARKAGP